MTAVLLVALSVAAAVLAWDTPLLAPAVVATLASVVSNAVMARHRRLPGSAPGWAAATSALAFAASAAILVATPLL